MEWLLVAAGIVSALSTACHLTIGYRQYLAPVNASNAGEISKRVMGCAYHYETVVLALTTVFLLMTGFGYEFASDPTLLIKFTALTYMLFTVVQLAYTVSARSMETFKGIMHWTLFLATAILAWIGA